MSQLVASYATDRYLLRLIQPDVETNGMILVSTSPSGESFTGGADLRLFEQSREACQQAEERYWQSMLSIAQPEDRAVLLSGWEHFRRYSGLPELNLKENDGNHQQTDG